MSDRRSRKAREPWGPDIAGVLACLVIAGMLGLSAVGFLMLCVIVAAIHGYRQGRGDRRARRRRETANLPRRQRPSRPRELPMPLPAAAVPRRSGPRPRYEPDDFDDDWGRDDDWDSGDDWDFDDDEPYGRPRRGGRRRAESWETGDAGYI